MTPRLPADGQVSRPVAVPGGGLLLADYAGELGCAPAGSTSAAISFRGSQHSVPSKKTSMTTRCLTYRHAGAGSRLAERAVAPDGRGLLETHRRKGVPHAGGFCNVRSALPVVSTPIATVSAPAALVSHFLQSWPSHGRCYSSLRNGRRGWSRWRRREQLCLDCCQAVIWDPF